MEVETCIPPAVDQIKAASGAVSSHHKSGAVAIIIPTFNAASHWAELHGSLVEAEVNPYQVLIIDSSSTDATRELAKHSGYQVVSIPQKDFNHGGTRQLASTFFPDAELLMFCTQDVVFRSVGAIESLAKALNDSEVGAAYGRQIARSGANAIERHARLFNYPAISQIRTFASRTQLGIKTAFISNSFAMYRRTALEQVGGFPGNVLIAEDSFVAARMLQAGWKIVYQADAEVIHSHRFGLRKEASRYFDIGAHHARENWMLETFGKADSEGKQFIKSEMRYLLANAPHLIPVAVLRTANKLAAYRLGSIERHLPTRLKKRISAYPQFWQNNRNR